MSRPMKIVFTASIILNVLFLGIAAGGMFHHEPREMPPWEKAKETLAPETIEVIKSTFKEKKEEIVPLFKEASQKKSAMKEVITAPEMDGDAYDALAEELKILNGKLMDHRISSIKAIFAGLPQEERAKIADHTVEKLLGKPPRPEKREGMRSHKTRRFDSERMHKKGAIDAAPGRMPFEAREPLDPPANQAE